MPGIGELPTSVLTHILLTATTHENLLAHAALCARAHPEWRRAVMGSAAYGLGIVGRSRMQGAAEAQITAATERARVLPKLGAALRQARADGKLELIAAYMGDAGARALDAAVRALPSPLALTELRLEGCLLTAAGMATIAGLMRDGRLGSQLKKLAFSVNELGDEGVTALAAALPPTLELLAVQQVGCGDAGMQAMARALPTTRVGQLLCYKNPAVTEEGWTALAAALPTTGVDRLTLRADFGDAGVVSLARGLPESSVRGLMLDACGVGDVGARALAAIIPRSPELILLDVRDNPIGAEGRAALEAATAQRPIFILKLPEEQQEEQEEQQAGQ